MPVPAVRLLPAAAVVLLATTVGAPIALAPPGWAATSNGEAAKSPKVILADARKATGAAKSVRIVASGKESGQEVSLNLVAARGDGGGTVRLGSAKFQVVLSGQRVYVKANKQTWKELGVSIKGAPGPAKLANRWVGIRLSNGGKQFAQFADITSVTNMLTSDIGPLVKRGTTTFHGQPAVRIYDTKNRGTAYVSTEGQPYLLGITAKDRNLTLTDYDSAQAPPVPKGAVSVSSLAGA